MDYAMAMERRSVFAERNANISKACALLSRSSVKPYQSLPPYLYLGVNHSFVYCAVPKTGSTFWKHTLKLIEHDMNVSSTYDYQIARLQRFKLTFFGNFRSQNNAEVVEKFMAGATSFMFVREPYGRIFSAYTNKIYNTNMVYWNMIGTKVVKTVRHNPSNDSLRFGHDVTFAEMIKFLVLKYKAGRNVDRHFDPMQSRCDPCKMKYKYIGKMETFADDAHYIINVLNQEKYKYSPLADFGKETALDISAGHVKFLYAVLAKTQDIKNSKYKFLLRTWREFQVRGLLSKTIEMPLTEKQASVIKANDYLNVIRTALQQPMNKTQVKLQRLEALIQAYRTVALEDLEILKKIVEPDCLLFGYEASPKWLFDRQHQDIDTSFNYFDAIWAKAAYGHKRTTHTQKSLRACAVWSKHSLFKSLIYSNSSRSCRNLHDQDITWRTAHA